MNFCVSMVASGNIYQYTAMMAAATYKHILNDVRVMVFLPQNEKIDSKLRHFSRSYGFELLRLQVPFLETKGVGRLIAVRHVLKLKAEWFKQSYNNSDCHVLFVDSDTVCVNEPDFSGYSVGIGLAHDLNPKYSSDHTDPDSKFFISEDNRSKYRNSGVMLADRNSQDFYVRFGEIVSECCDSYNQKFADQCIINYLIHTEFKDRLYDLDKKYNHLNGRMSLALERDESISIFHSGWGFNNNKGKGSGHHKICMRILDG